LGILNYTQRKDLQRQWDDFVDSLCGFLWNVLYFAVEMVIDRVGKITKESGLLMIFNLREIYRVFSSWSQKDEPLFLLRNLSSAICEEEFCAISLLVPESSNFPNDLSIELKVFLDKHPKLGVWWKSIMGYLII
jgi:hypothetical protein